MYIDERLALTSIAVILALAVSIVIGRKRVRSAVLLSLATSILTWLLLYYYFRYVHEASHGMAILILPLATVWLWWRRENTGKPAISNALLISLQVAYGLLYLLIVNLQGL